MSSRICRVVTCDRCSKHIYLEKTGTETPDWGETYDVYQELPKEWMYNSEIGYLCPECARVFQLFVLDFFDRNADKIAPAWKYALTKYDLGITEDK